MARSQRNYDVKRLTVELPLSVFDKILDLQQHLEAGSYTEVVIRCIRSRWQEIDTTTVGVSETAEVEIGRGDENDD